MNGSRLLGWAPVLTRLLLGGALVFGLGTTVAQAGPGRPDPRQMSGMPRPDPQIPAGEVTVRVLDGSFDQPVLGTTVELELRSADGRVAELRSAQTANQGRAYFRELTPFIGGQAVARVVLDGETVRSRQIDLLAQSGTAVMLVKGAPKPKGAAQNVSLPGIVFDFPRTEAGSLMVGVFDLAKREGLTGTEVQLEITLPDGTVETRSLTTEKMGQTTFEGLAELPAGATVQVQASLDDQEPYRSMTFTPAADRGQAVVLARGRMSAAGSSPHQDAPGAGAPARPKPLPPARIAKELPLGTVELMVIDGTGQPVVDHEVTIVKKDFAGTESRYSVSTDGRGVARKDELPVVSDALYYVGVKYDDAPYTSSFFGLDKRGGVKLAMRVWEVTSDVSVVRSAVQFEVIEGENDKAQVIQLYQVMVQGEKAYWPDEPLDIVGMPGAKGFVVLRGAEDWLDHEDKAPFARLAHPIPPGELAPLSVGYVVEHSGTVELNWTPPFDVAESVVIASDKLEVDAPNVEKADRPVPEQAGLDYTRVAWVLGQRGKGAVQASVRKLRRTDPTFRTIATGVGGMLGLVVLGGLAFRPRGGTRARINARREQLMAALVVCEEPRRRRRLIAALDRVYRQTEALDAVAKARKPRPTA